MNRHLATVTTIDQGKGDELHQTMQIRKLALGLKRDDYRLSYSFGRHEEDKLRDRLERDIPSGKQRTIRITLKNGRKVSFPLAL